MRPSVLAALGIAVALFVGAGTFVALDARLGPADAPPPQAPTEASGDAAPDADGTTIATPDDGPAPEADDATPAVSETPTPETAEAEPEPAPRQPEPRQPEPRQPEPQPETRPAPPPAPPVAAEPACDPTPLIRRITQLTTRDCPGHTDPDRKRACYAEIERLNSELAACTS